MASIGIFGDPVTPTQYFGYSIALGGLIYYKLGGEKLQQLGTQTRLVARDFQRENPGRTRVIMVVAAIGLAILVIWSWLPGTTSVAT